MQTEKLSISLPLEMARMIRRQVEEGTYASNSEVIREALRLWLERGQAQRLVAIRASLEAAAEDPTRLSDDEVRAHFDRLLAKAEQSLP